MIRTLVFIVVLCIANVKFCLAGEISKDIKDLIAPDARTLTVLNNPDGVVQQISFTLVRTYPLAGVTDLQIKQLLDAGWHQCRDTGWESFIDETRSPPIMRFQRIIDLGKGTTTKVVVGMQYKSPAQTHVGPSNISPSNEQIVSITRFDLRNPHFDPSIYGDHVSC